MIDKVELKEKFFEYVCKEIRYSGGIVGIFPMKEYENLLRRFNYFWNKLVKEVKK